MDEAKESMRVYRVMFDDGPVTSYFDVPTRRENLQPLGRLVSVLLSQGGMFLDPSRHPDLVTVPTFIPLHAILRIQDITDRPDLPIGEG